MNTSEVNTVTRNTAVLLAFLCVPAIASADTAEYRQILDKYCVTCHNQRLKAADLLLDQADLTKPAEHAAVWEKVHRKLREGSMPPPGLPRPPPPPPPAPPARPSRRSPSPAKACRSRSSVGSAARSPVA